MSSSARPASSAPSDAYGWFARGVGSWFGAFGMHALLFSWLVAGELAAAPEWIGIAQSSTMLPSLLLLLLGGATADRHDVRRLLVRLHALAALPPLLLATLLIAGRLSLPAVILYGLAVGTVSAFVMPARDALLSRVAGRDMMRAVTGMTVVQFGAQATGTFLAGASRVTGYVPVLLVQAGLLVLGSWWTSRVPPTPPVVRDGPRRSALHEIGDGLGQVARTPILRSTLALVCSVGLLFVGPFMVLFPLLVRDHYGGDALDLALVQMQFPLGTIAGSAALRARGGIRRKGLAALVALACGAVALFGIGLGPPYPGLVALTFAWGLGGAVFINCSRTLFQEAAPEAHRARVLSTYQLGLLGAAPVGAMVAGLVSGGVGTLATLQLFACGMLLFVALSWTIGNTARME